MWKFQIDWLARNVCLSSTRNSSWQLLHHTKATTQNCLLRSKHLGLRSTHRTKGALLPATATHHKHTHFIRSGWDPEKSSVAHWKIAVQMLNPTSQIPVTEWETNSPPAGMRRMENSMPGHLSTFSSSTTRNMQLFLTVVVSWMPRNKTEKQAWDTCIGKIDHQNLTHDAFCVTGKLQFWQLHVSVFWRNENQDLG